MYSLGDQIKAG